MENKIVVVDDEPMNAFYYCDSMHRLRVHHCDICGEKVSLHPIRIHDPINMCLRCRNWYELLPGVLLESLRRVIIGNVL